MVTFCLFLVFVMASAKLAPLENHPTKEVIANQYIVVLKKETPDSVAQVQIENVKAQIGKENILHTYTTVLKGFSAVLTPAQLLQIRQNPFVSYVEVDSVVKASKVEQGSCISQTQGSWGQTRIAEEQLNLDGTYSASSTAGEGVTAYVVDTGIYVHNVDFDGRAHFGFKAMAAWSNTDNNGHGTHVASTVGGKTYGVAKKVTLYAVKVLGDNGQGTDSGVIAGVDWVASNYTKGGKKPSTANLSLGGGKSLVLNAAVNEAVLLGITFVVAAGNSNDNACDYSPSSASSAITVGSTDVGAGLNGEVDIRSYFSNYGSCLNVFGPGSLIKAAWIGTPTATNTISGTSMASPHVCGIVALLLADNPKLTPNQLRNTIVGDANPNMIDLKCGTNPICKESPNLLAYNGC